MPWLNVNANSERFMNENISYVNLGMTVALQPEHKTYQIFDSRWGGARAQLSQGILPHGRIRPHRGRRHRSKPTHSSKVMESRLQRVCQ